MKKIFKIILFCLIFFVVIICSNINSAFAFDDDSLYYENLMNNGTVKCIEKIVFIKIK